MVFHRFNTGAKFNHLPMPTISEEKPTKQKIRIKLHEIIFEADTPAGKLFDILLLVFILYSIAVVMLETVREIDIKYHNVFFYSEWGLTILFSVEYFLRILSVKKPLKYMTSFYGVVDLLAILPTYLSLIVAGSQYFLTIRALRLLRVFRIFKLGRFLIESKVLLEALRASKPKIIIFLGTVFTIVIIIGSGMYLIEGSQDSGFTSIPRSMYWAIVTLTTVGYGDIIPVTTLGQFLSAILMITGYAIIAVPTGIISVEIAQAHNKMKKGISTQACQTCGKEGHEPDAVYCKFCGARI